MSKGKLAKFQELADFPNAFQNFSWEQPALKNHLGEIVELSGRWSEAVFGNSNPITLELACGRAEYTVGLAERYPDRNFVAVDIKGNRIWFGARQALDRGLKNAAFLRTDIALLDRFFGPEEVSEFWITFPDPYLKKSRKRLTSRRFLERYRRLAQADALVHLKTDELRLYDFTLAEAAAEELRVEVAVADIHAGPLPQAELTIKTYYEGLHIADGEQVSYVRFQLFGSEGLDDVPHENPSKP